ncbi:MAG: hypothetical protein C3F19_00480 [Rhodocyclales bacterium]|nr:MAG: hypothetical protein C3F19_00480 [Rhodocyclales bacterium]
MHHQHQAQRHTAAVESQPGQGPYQAMQARHQAFQPGDLQQHGQTRQHEDQPQQMLEAKTHSLVRRTEAAQ